MKQVSLKTDIIPIRQVFNGTSKTFDFRAICIFAATGFFLDNDSYYNEQKVLRPAYEYALDESGTFHEGKPWFNWRYTPRDISLKEAVEEFAELFEQINKEQAGGRTVILPLSGGLDSRTQAAAFKQLNQQVHSFSYSFQSGINEAAYGERIAKACGFEFENWTVRKGYLWEVIDRLAATNKCYSEFTHPRQMAFHDRYAILGDVFSLGHWGDVLFDDMKVPDDLSFSDQVLAIKKKIVKKGGAELARALWLAWGLKGDFDDYLDDRLNAMLAKIDIPNSANARIRAFKSLYWAPRWTSINLSVFEQARPVSLPYYDNRMCAFICTIPEKHLANRKIQIEYLKWRSPDLARIPWQEHRPFNLFGYQWDRSPYNWPYRAYTKAGRLVRSRTLIQRNWELQFLGESNKKKLDGYLYDRKFNEWIPERLVKNMEQQFTLNPVHFSHPISMLLTLSAKIRNDSNNHRE